MRLRWLIPVFVVSLFASSANAADISLSVDVVARGDQVQIQLSNTGKDRAEELGLRVELAGRVYSPLLPQTLAAGEKISAATTVEVPSKLGTYPLVTTVSYRNDKETLSLKNVGVFHSGKELSVPVGCRLPTLQVRERAWGRFAVPENVAAHTVFPDELQIKEETRSGFHRLFIKNKRPFIRGRTTYFVVYEQDTSDTHATTICRGILLTHPVVKAKSFFGMRGFGAIALAAFLLLVFLSRRFPIDLDRTSNALVFRRWLFSVVTIGGALFLYHVLAWVPDLLLGRFQFDHRVSVTLGTFAARAVRGFLQWLYFEGGDYDLFSKHVQDPLFLCMLTVNFAVLRFLVRPQIATDKYVHLMRWSVHVPRVSAHWTRQARTALLTLCVKFYYVPLLASWTINNIFHQIHLQQSFSLTFLKVNEYIVASCILIDVAVFALGYFTELPQLKNQIRSVEPTVLGWAACLICYPPFNTFAFVLFDHPLNESWRGLEGGSGAYLVTVAITALWIVYLSATLALGLKSSNLTNRGIVARGPYRFIRHPAYVSKVALWILSAVFLGEKNFFLILALIVVYALRAWTEERHLSQDPTYLEYKKRVPWVMVPRVF